MAVLLYGTTSSLHCVVAPFLCSHIMQQSVARRSLYEAHMLLNAAITCCVPQHLAGLCVSCVFVLCSVAVNRV